MESNYLKAGVNGGGVSSASLRMILMLLSIGLTSACSHLPMAPSSVTDASSSERIDEADRFYALGQHREAQAAYQTIARDYPSFSYGWFKLGNTSVRLGQPELAVAYYEQAISLDGNDQRYWYNLSLAHLQLAKLRAQAAIGRNPQADNTELLRLIAQIDAAGQP